MKVLLTEPVDKLGEVGDVVKVADGYARNYLLPKGLAVSPTEHNKKRFEKKRKRRMAAIQEREERANELKSKLDEMVMEFERPAHEGRLYGSVRRRDIAARIEEELGESVERARINLETPIEETGAYLIPINLYKDITAEVRVKVTSESEGEAEKEGNEEETE